MLRVVMFDLGLTLIDSQNRPFDHVREALAAIAAFKTADGKPLRSCLVSDYTLAPAPATAAKVRAIFKQYLQVLAQTGLQPFFEPVQRRVTLSTHAGVAKPERAVFETALRRLHVQATLSECLFITENASHIQFARAQLQMQTLQFRTAGVVGFDFDDWSQAPALIAHRIGPGQPANLHAAVSAHLAARGIELTALQPSGQGNTLRAAAQVWQPLEAVAGLPPLHVALPVQVELSRGNRGELLSTFDPPGATDLAEATAFVGSLAAHGQIAVPGAEPAGRTTHEAVVADNGQLRLLRRRFSAA